MILKQLVKGDRYKDALAKSTIKLSNKKYLEAVEFQNSAVFYMWFSIFKNKLRTQQMCVNIKLSTQHREKR